jgi:hypothetical protein
VGEAVDQDEGADPLGVAGREMYRPPARYPLHHQRWSLEPHRVEEGSEISVEDVSCGGVEGVTLRCAHAPGVKPESTTEDTQPPANPDESGVLRQQIDRRGGVHEHQVERPVPAHLVGQVGPVGRTGVAGLRGIRHGSAR